MTVTTVALAALIVAVIIMALVISKQLTQLTGLSHVLHQTSRTNADHEALLIAAVVNKAQLPGELSPLDSKKWSTLMDLYDEPYLMGYTIPAQITTDENDTPTVYWKITNVNELSAYEIARLWLAGVL